LRSSYGRDLRVQLDRPRGNRRLPHRGHRGRPDCLAPALPPDTPKNPRIRGRCRLIDRLNELGIVNLYDVYADK